jgi:exportin-7
MSEVLNIFVQMCINNLMTSEKSESIDDQRICDQSLDVFSSYLNNTSACRQISQLEIIRQLVTTHITQFNILQAPRQHKQLGQFFRVLSGLWVTEEFVGEFHEYLDQLVPQIQQIFSIEPSQLAQTQGAKLEVIKIFYILRGILRGMTNSKTFNLFFDWFYPQYLGAIIEGTLNSFY